MVDPVGDVGEMGVVVVVVAVGEAGVVVVERCTFLRSFSSCSS